MSITIDAQSHPLAALFDEIRLVNAIAFALIVAEYSAQQCMGFCLGPSLLEWQFRFQLTEMPLLLFHVQHPVCKQTIAMEQNDGRRSESLKCGISAVNLGRSLAHVNCARAQ